MRAKILWFYPGISLSAYRRLTIDDRAELWESITIIEAQQALNQVKVVMWPKLKSSKRDELHKELHTKAFPWIYEKQAGPVDPKTLAQYIGKGKKHG